MSKTIKSDALVTDADIADIKAEINRGEYSRLMFELLSREPNLAIFVSNKYAVVSTLLDGEAIPADIRAHVQKHLSLLVWTPLLLLDRVQRRAWDEFMPSEDDFFPEELPDENDDGHVCEFEDHVQGVAVGLHIDRLRLLCPNMDEAAVRELIERHAATIGQEMLEAGIAAAERLFTAAGDQP